MSAGNIKDKGSNYGSNYSYQLSVLQLLDTIATGSGGGGCCPTAATENTLANVTAKDSTLGAILSQLQQGAIFYSNLVIDNTGATYSEVRVYDSGTSTFTTTYYDAGGSVVVPVAPIVYVNPQTVLNNILLQVSATPRTSAMFRTSTSGTITAGKRSVSIRNAGSANGTVLGANLLPGEIVSFDAGALKDTLGAITYNGTGTDLLITTLV